MEVRHISEGRNLEPLADTAKFTLKMDRKSYGLSFGGICFDLEWPGEVKSRTSIFDIVKFVSIVSLLTL